MKKISLAILAICAIVLLSPFHNFAFADTTIDADVTTDTTWTAANSPYIVSKKIIVNNGATLTIEPGVIVKFKSTVNEYGSEIGGGLNVYGALVAKGTALSNIIFSKFDSSSHFGISINRLPTLSGQESDLKPQGSLEYVKSDGMEMLDVNFRDTLIDHCNFKDVDRVDITNSRSIISNSLFKLLRIYNSSAQVFGNKIYSNMPNALEVLGKTANVYNNEIIKPACTYFMYSNWGSCVSGIQSREVTYSSPDNCAGGDPILQQSCKADVKVAPIKTKIIRLTGKATENLTLRATKNDKSKKLGQLKKGSSYEIVNNTDKMWTKVKANGKEGYVMKKYLIIK